MSFDTTLANLGINRTSTAPTVNATNKSQQMDQADFLTLMTAQLKNQDPFDPVDNTQMVAQMAQFSSLAGISEMNTTLKAIAERLGGTTTSDALSWVGRTVLTEGSVAYPRSDGSLSGQIELDAAASNVTVSISDANGQVLRTVELGAQPKGAIDFEWDGTTESGEAAGAGPFTIKVGAHDADNKTVASRALVWAPVASVALVNGQPVLSLPGIGQIPTSAVRQIG